MKQKKKYTCTKCNYQSPKWIGKCPECESWNSFEEEIVVEKKGREIAEGNILKTTKLENQKTIFSRIKTGINEVDLVFGNGIAEGSISLLSGEPGIGKSTLTLQICDAFLKNKKNVLYVTGEESMGQVAQRGKRLGINLNMEIVNETGLEDIVETAKIKHPDLLVIDSIQVIYSDIISGIPGSITQVRFATEKLMELAKTENITVLLIGHVTKDGSLAGPRVLEHLVDCVLYLEGDRHQNVRLLKTFKNRFGATDEVGVFEMTEKGMEEVKNPNALFLEKSEHKVGSAVASILEGTRPFFIEVQALVTYTKFGYPKRTVSGIDLNRLNIILAVLGKYANINLDNYDVYVSTVGGFNTKDRGIDLAVALAIVSSKLGKSVGIEHSSVPILAIGEIGLTGSIRPVFQMEKRIKGVEKMGIKEIIVPFIKNDTQKNSSLKKVKDIKEAIDIIFE